MIPATALRHLREQKLVRTISIPEGRSIVVLTERGDVLERPPA